MNRSLLIFSLLVIFAGLALGLYIISFFGLLLLLPALATPSRPAQKPPPQPAQQPLPRRVTPRSTPPSPPPPAPTPMAEPVSPPPASMGSMVTSYSASSTSPAQQASYSPALFPGPLLPSMSVVGSAPQPAKPHEARHEERDELVEVGAVLAILKLVFG